MVASVILSCELDFERENVLDVWKMCDVCRVEGQYVTMRGST